MITVGMIVKVLPDAEYSGKFTGCVGSVKRCLSHSDTGNKIGVEIFNQKNKASSQGLFWFSESKLAPVNIIGDSEALASVQEFLDMERRRYSRFHRTGIPPVKRVIYSGPKTIVLWADGTKTIVSCGEGETYDHYTGFCAAVVKKLFGSTTHAKKVLGKVIQVP